MQQCRIFAVETASWISATFSHDHNLQFKLSSVTGSLSAHQSQHSISSYVCTLRPATFSVVVIPLGTHSFKQTSVQFFFPKTLLDIWRSNFTPTLNTKNANKIGFHPQFTWTSPSQVWCYCILYYLYYFKIVTVSVFCS